MAIDWQRVGRGLSGFSAGHSGRGPEYLASLAAQKKQQFNDEEAKRQESLKRFSGSIQGTYELINKGDMRGAIALLSSSKDPTLQAVSGELSNPETSQEAVNDITDFFNRGVANGAIKPREKSSARREFEFYESLVAKAKASGDPADMENARQYGLTIGVGRESEQEKADIQADLAKKKAINTRQQGYIDSGVAAADSAAQIKRSLDLLETVKTGGIHNAIDKAARLFGVQGKDALELSTNMGQTFLTQLKPIFGAAFSVNEVKLLKSISAGFGSSTAGNVRLLKQALKIVNRSARRGRAAAIELGDEFTADEISKSLEFKITGEQPKKEAQAVPSQQGSTPSQQKNIRVTF